MAQCRWFVTLMVTTWTIGGAVVAATTQAPLRPRSVLLPGTDIVLEAGWQLVFTPDEACAYTVPSTWPVARDRAWATKPDGRISAALDDPSAASWAMHKMRLAEAFKPTTVLDDSDHRFWVERADAKRILHHISLTDGRTICSADVEVLRSMEPSSDIVSKIISGMRVAHDRDRRWMKE